jgi:hypothetical protein
MYIKAGIKINSVPVAQNSYRTNINVSPRSTIDVGDV